MKRTALRRSSPEKIRAWQQRTATKLGAGKKTKAWTAERRTLKQEFEALGITSCEVRWEGCWRDNALGYAHSLKRRNIKGAQIREVCLACNNCHDKLELKPEAEMARIVREIIARRYAHDLRIVY